MTVTALAIAFACLHAGLGNTELERVTHTFALVPIMAVVTLIARQRPGIDQRRRGNPAAA